MDTPMAVDTAPRATQEPRRDRGMRDARAVAAQDGHRLGRGGTRRCSRLDEANFITEWTCWWTAAAR